MAQKDIEKFLREIGLSENELKIYLQLIDLGNAAISVLANRIGITKAAAKYACAALI